jgi:hypothetical protein
MPVINQLLDEVNSLIGWLFWILFLISVFVLIVGLFRWLYGFYSQTHREPTILEITPHAQGDKTPSATNQLFMSLHALAGNIKWYEKLLGKRQNFSLEIVATKSSGIRFIIRCDQSYSETIQHIISSYTSDVKVKETTDYISSLNHPKILEFKQKAHFAYPLQDNLDPQSHDPISYITNAMTKLEPSELMALQIVIQPTSSREAEIINHRIMTNENLMPRLSGRSIPLISWLGRILSDLLFAVADAFSIIFSNGSSRGQVAATKNYEHERQVAKGIKPARTLSYFEHQMVELISTKLSQQLFLAEIRVMIDIDDSKRYTTRRKNIESAFNVYSVPKYQALSLRRAKHHLLSSYSLYCFSHRTSSLMKIHSNKLSVAEVANLYHFPHTVSAKTENVVKSLSKTLPAPISLKNNSQLDVVIGINKHQGVDTPIGLTAAERERHLYIIGGTGNGKTTMMEYGIVQDIKNGKGVAVLDPHGDLAEKLLGYIPKERIKDVIYFNPSDLGYPIGINLLELPEGIEGDELIDAKDFITETVISVMRKVFSDDDSGGHRIEYMLRNAVQTALTQPDATLFTVYDLLTNSKFRSKVTRTLQDQKLKNFWKEEFGKAGAMQKVKMAAGVTAKIGRFQFSASAERIISQPKSTVNFNDILDGKILICNLAKGLIGEDTSELFGISVLAKLQLAAYQRVKVNRESRKPFYIYVDEFQNFATMSFVQLLSEARKYKLNLMMANQYMAQIPIEVQKAILGNAGSIAAFTMGADDARIIMKEFGDVFTDKDLVNLENFQIALRLMVDSMSGRAFVARTLPLPASKNQNRDKVIRVSRERWGRG